jgi:hypothetical protein
VMISSTVHCKIVVADDVQCAANYEHTHIVDISEEYCIY